MKPKVEIAGYPRGWFVVGFGADLPAAGVKPLKYFGQDLVVYRGADGVARTTDAFCPHLGAHLGYGGTVVGNAIQCPFHAWRFGESGACVEIPYAKKIPPGARLRVWPTVERNGTILVWHDPAGGAPDFEIPAIEEHGSDAWLPWATDIYHVATHPREVVDNLADKAHFPHVHQTKIEDFRFETEGHTATQFTRGISYQGEKVIDRFTSTTTYHGPGLLIMHMVGVLENFMILAHTPVDEGHLDLRIAIMLRIVKDRATTQGFMKMYLDNVKAGFEDDLKIWEHKVYRDQPLLCEGDGPIGKMRRWYRQFYTPVLHDGGVHE
jgi:3-ketosteroid 9alpha-monooxygenase subunit A